MSTTLPPKRDSSWVRYLCCSALGGRGISTLLGPDPIVPTKALDVGKFSLSLDHVRYEGLDLCGLDQLAIIAPRSLDHIFVGPRLQTVTDPEHFLPTLLSKLKLGGHAVFHLEAPFSTPLRGWLESCGTWQEKDTLVQEGQLAGVWKLTGATTGTVLPPKPRAAKRACISRYGAIGDLIMVTPLIRALAEDGYEVTCNVTPYSAEVLKGNPHVGNTILQERDIIPNPELGPYWDFWRSRYDKYINLSETIEGALLKVEGRRDFYTHRDFRSRTCASTNYYDYTMAVGGYPDRRGQCGELYFNSGERKAARYVRERTPGFLVLWALKGSSHHKQWPWLRPALTEWLAKRPDATVLLTGATTDRDLGWEAPQVHNLAGEPPLREVFALAQLADLVVGPESALVNAAGCFDTPKLVLRSHSSCENLCKYFRNHTCLAPTSPCAECHQLHYSLESCPLITITDTVTNQPSWRGPRCCAEISPERVLASLDQAYNEWKRKSAYVQGVNPKA